MAYKTETYATIRKRLLEFIPNDSAGDNVTDLPLDLINRARDELCLHRRWAGLRKTATLTLSGKTATLPSDCGEILSVFHDTDSDLLPEYRYYQSSAKSDNGYKKVVTYDKDSGTTEAITFYSTPTHTPQIRYRAVLPDFTGTGTEYLFFPGELLLAKAKQLSMEDNGMTSDGEYDRVVKRVDELMKDFIHAHQNENIEPIMEILDSKGRRLDEESYDLGSGAEGNYSTDDDNDVDQGDYY